MMSVGVAPDRLVAMTGDNSKPLLGIGWVTQKNFEPKAYFN
jgi:hypothetical protein